MIVFHDAEAVLIAHLTEVLNGVPVSSRVPNPRPETFVRLTRVGGGRRDLVTDSPMVVFECWSDDEDTASDLGALVRAHVWAMRSEDVQGVSIGRITEVGGLQAYPDPATETPRYQFTASIDMRGREA